MQVTLGLPLYDHPKAEMMLSLITNLLGEFPHQVHLSPQRGPYLSVNREAVMRDAIAAGSEKVLFIDSDLAFPPDAMARIVAHHKAIIGGNYYLKQLPLVSAVKMDDGHGGYLNGPVTLKNEPFMCAAVPTGFLALHLPTITAKMQPPFFEYDRQAQGFAGEDVVFCQKARAAGLEIWCDPTIRLLHMGNYAYGLPHD